MLPYVKMQLIKFYVQCKGRFSGMDVWTYEIFDASLSCMAEATR